MHADLDEPASPVIVFRIQEGEAEPENFEAE
jgi:hypothetical protein